MLPQSSTKPEAKMGVSPTAILEIDAFRLEGDPTVLNVRTVKEFLTKIVGHNQFSETSVTVEDVEWLYGNDVPKVEGKNWEDTCNIPGEELIDQELRVSGTIVWNKRGLKTKFSFASHYHAYNEYLGNSKEHSIVVSFAPDWGTEMSVGEFARGCMDLTDFQVWVWSAGINHTQTETYITCTTT